MGFSVYPVKSGVSNELIEQYKSIPTSHISDNMNRLYGNSASLKPYHNGGKLIGSAITVRTRPGDNLMIHKAINMSKPGDVLVVDGGGDMTRALFGEIMMYTSQSRGIAGIIIDGCIRDVDAFKNGDFPIYAKGVTHKGPYKTGPGEVNVTVSVGDLIVNPGDLIVGDEDGVVSIPVDQAESILEGSLDKINKENEKIQSIVAGDITESYIDDETLIKMGCKFYDE